MIYLLRKHGIISVPSYAEGIYHPPKVGIISKIYHPFREERISLKTPSLYHNEGVFMVDPRRIDRLRRQAARILMAWCIAPSPLCAENLPLATFLIAQTLPSSTLPPPKKQKPRHKCVKAFAGGPEEDRTPDLTNANRTLSQLSYGPEYHIYSITDFTATQYRRKKKSACRRTFSRDFNVCRGYIQPSSFSNFSAGALQIGHFSGASSPSYVYPQILQTQAI